VDELEVEPQAPPDQPTIGPDGEPLNVIEGVELERLSPHVDHRGSLTELINFRRPFWHEPIVHAYEVAIAPGRIKGWGMHGVQADRYVVTSASMRVVLYDGRVQSPTYERLMEIHFSERSPGLLRIPPGVWHADQNTGEEIARFVNFPTHAYDPAHPDKHRLDPHSDAIPFDWALRDG
jgi:dTDP-4-dehydrorhamnose 3,5-epimerase